MNKDLIIDVKESGVEIALLEDKKLVELHKDNPKQDYVAGNIYLGQVKKIMAGLNSAFVDVGSGKDGFLHYLDLGHNFKRMQDFVSKCIAGNREGLRTQKQKTAELEKNGLITDVLKQGQMILVQVTKEPISTKGPRLSGEISFAGRYVVLIPFGKKITVSQKIKSNEERKRLRRLLTSIVPDDTGLIIRTAAEGKSVAELDADVKELTAKWEAIATKLYNAVPPVKMVAEAGSSIVMIRDLLSDEFNNIYVNDQQTYDELHTYISKIFPEKEDILHYYKMQTPIFEQFSVENQIKNAFGKVVTIRSGIYLVIEQTEAMAVIDVNSGPRTKASQDQEENALMVNTEAAVEIARQLRLRDMGGIIVIDFIDMNSKINCKKLYDTMKEVMSHDKARHTILPLSKFCLMQITRQRIRPVVDVEVSELCPTCGGSGQIKSSVNVISNMKHDVKFLTEEQNEKRLTILAHPFVASYLNKGWWFNKVYRKWEKDYNVKIKVKENNDLAVTEYNFLNADGTKIEL
ncbi:MAG: Rne/Rng family ribonuclease [Bacteroidales bacterium]|nr:Rne/Rng family ribonuclease [Bacteroidales bacterium]